MLVPALALVAVVLTVAAGAWWWRYRQDFHPPSQARVLPLGVDFPLAPGEWVQTQLHWVRLVPSAAPTTDEVRLELRRITALQSPIVTSLPWCAEGALISLVGRAGSTVTLHVDRAQPTDAEFKTVDSNSFMDSCCTPAKDFPWHGIVIAAPRAVAWARECAADWKGRHAQHPVPRIIIAGTHLCPRAGFVPQPGRSRKEPTLIITNTATGEVVERDVETISREYAHAVQGMNISYHERDDEPDEPEASSNMSYASGGPFNADIGLYIPPPTEPTTWEVVAEFGTWRSNVVRLVVSP